MLPSRDAGKKVAAMPSWIRWLLGMICAWGLISQPAPAADRRVAILEIQGAITPAIANYVSRGLDQARNDEAVVLLIDTPGGLDSAMRDIVQRIMASRVPVIAYVSPAGARAASAGVFLVMASHVAAMAPNTAIGAASPVNTGGEDIQGTMKAKVTNDAAAYIRGLARDRQRNAVWAENAVRHAVSASAAEALQLHVVDLLAPDLPTLLDRLDGRGVRVGEQRVILHTRHATLERLELQPLERSLQMLSNPSLALLLLNLGMLGLFFELSNPGLIIPGIVGGICLLLALFALGTLPVNVAGVALIAFAFLLFVAELFLPTFGALAVGGVISLVLGALMLITPGTPGFEVSRWLIATIALATGGLMAGLVTLAVRAQRRPPTTGQEGLVGRRGEARTPLDPEGQVFVHGELWRAISEEGPLPAGAPIQVRRVANLTLHVVAVPPQQEEAHG